MGTESARGLAALLVSLAIAAPATAGIVVPPLPALKVPSTTTLGASPSTLACGSTTVLTATVTGGPTVPTGLVTFRDFANVPVGTGTINGAGVATASVAVPRAGSFPYTASYPGDANYLPSISGASAVTVTPVTTALRLAASANPAIGGTPVTFTATMSPPAACEPPTGLVTFTNNNVTLGTASLSGGVATFTTSSLPVSRSHFINATYAGTASYGPANAGGFPFAVTPAGTIPLTVTNATPLFGNVVSTPGFIGCGLSNACVDNFAPGTVVTLQPSPNPRYAFIGWSGACTGLGACQVTMDAAKAVTATFGSPTAIPRLANISTRMQVLTGNDVLIGGFIIGGSAPKTVVVRARGPSLIPFGITNALANPIMQLFSGQTVIATSDDWGTAANAAALSTSGFAPSSPLESAILTTLSPGAYTAVVSGVGGTTGVGIIEVFEVDKPEVPLANISTRGQVLTGNDVMIGGFVIQGDTPQTVVVRARGPSLVPFGITNALMDPVLQLLNGATLIATNDDWQVQTVPGDVAAIQASGFAPGDTREAVIRITLPPGAYTAIVSGKNGTTGVGIIEAFAQ